MSACQNPRRPGKWYCRDCNSLQCNFEAYNEDDAVICKVMPFHALFASILPNAALNAFDWFLSAITVQLGAVMCVTFVIQRTILQLFFDLIRLNMAPRTQTVS